jgi:hypothetical protein
MANLTVKVEDGNNINVQVTPVPQQKIEISRGLVGPVGPSGESNIGGYPISLSGPPQNFDALMFVTGNWTNIPQTEISDGGNF